MATGSPPARIPLDELLERRRHRAALRCCHRELARLAAAAKLRLDARALQAAMDAERHVEREEAGAVG